MGLFEIDLKVYDILIIEDALEFKQLISQSLGRSPKHKYVSTLNEARNMLKQNHFDCVILDLSLPDGNGYDLMREQIFGDTPIIILTSSAEIGNKVMGLSMGAQDFISKPFDSLELAARVKNKIDLNKNSEEKQSVQKLGNLNVDITRRKVSFEGKDKEIELTRKEFECLLVFMKNQEIVLSRESLLNKVWGEENFVMERSVDSTIVGLRKKLKGWSFKIKSIYGVGYQLVQNIKKQSSTEHSDELYQIFFSESEKQIKEFKEKLYLGEWEDCAKLAHKLKGTISIFDQSIIPSADNIETRHNNGQSISEECAQFVEIAEKCRKSILDQAQQKKAA